MLSPCSSSWTSPPSSSCTVPVMTTNSSSESPCAYGSVPVEPPGSSSPANTSRCWSGRGVRSSLRPRIPNASDGRSSRRRTRGRGGPLGSNRSATVTPRALAIRRSEAMLALARPRSTWLRKLSLTPARSAIILSVARRSLRMSRRRSPTSTSVLTSGTLEGIQISLDLVEGKLKRPYGVGEAKSMGAAEAHEETRRDEPDERKGHERRGRRAEEKRNGEHEAQCEREDEVRPGDDDPHERMDRGEERLPRKAEQRPSQLPLGMRRERTSGAVGELVERQLPARI